MPETETLPATQQETQEQAPSRLGRVEAMRFTPQPFFPEDGLDGAAVNTPADTPTNAPADTPADTPANTTTVTDEQVREYLKAQGIEFDNLEKLKEKVNTPAAQSPEEKTQAAAAREKRLLDLFIEGGGTAEQYVAIKNISDTNVKDLSISNLKAELKAEKFTDEQIEAIIKERYYQIPDDEIEQYEDETDKEFAKRKKEYGAKKLANRSSHTKQQAQDILKGLNKALETADSEAQEEVLLSSKIDEHFTTLPRKLTFELGQAGTETLPPITYEVAEADMTEIKDLLKDPAKRNNFFFNPEGGFNLTNITKVLTRNKFLETAVKKAYHEGGERQIAAFRTTFPAGNPYELGIGGGTGKTADPKEKAASYGKPQRVSRPLTT